MRRFAVVVAAALMLSACTEEPKEAQEGPAPKLTSTDVSSLRVTGQQQQPSALAA